MLLASIGQMTSCSAGLAGFHTDSSIASQRSQFVRRSAPRGLPASPWPLASEKACAAAGGVWGRALKRVLRDGHQLRRGGAGGRFTGGRGHNHLDRRNPHPRHEADNRPK